MKYFSGMEKGGEINEVRFDPYGLSLNP